MYATTTTRTMRAKAVTSRNCRTIGGLDSADIWMRGDNGSTRSKDIATQYRQRSLVRDLATGRPVTVVLMLNIGIVDQVLAIGYSLLLMAFTAWCCSRLTLPGE
jgi:hypothetical protein